jgi:hypothetical protein
MIRRIHPFITLAAALLLAIVPLQGQEKPKLPTQQETLAKWPWSIKVLPFPLQQQRIQFTLKPAEGMEYKYRLEQGASFVYSWTATSDLYWELHSEPDGSPRGYAEFFDTNQGAASNGAYQAPFPGIHGWWWENKTDREVTITLSTAGFYTESREFRRGQPVKITPLK